jgi:hypothetical protein
VLLVMPLLLWLHKKEGYRIFMIIGSAIILVQALWWLLERTGIVGSGI